jgi:8-oxo-dGTP pyrophosphatase MutT (NUDIX family)
LSDVDAAWEQLQDSNPRFHDGGVLHVLGVSRNGSGGVTMHVAESSYRFHAVRRLGLETGIRPLGAKAIVACDGKVLLGLRSEQSGSYPGCWEYVPGGTVEPSLVNDSVDPRMTVRRELLEETGFDSDATIVPLAVFLDTSAQTWEVVHGVEVDPRVANSIEGFSGWEHQRLCWNQPGCCPEPASNAARVLDSVAKSFASGKV